MIAFLEGELAEAWPTQVVISVQGVGYLVQIPLSSFDHLPAVGQRVRLLTHLVVREDAHLLFGFASSAERDLFRLLLQHVSGVGPKLALAVLRGMTVSQFKAAVVRGAASCAQSGAQSMSPHRTAVIGVERAMEKRHLGRDKGIPPMETHLFIEIHNTHWRPKGREKAGPERLVARHRACVGPHTLHQVPQHFNEFCGGFVGRARIGS